MSLISAQNLSKEFGTDEIFSGVSLDIPQRARIALVGPNGAGKTTLLNVLIGDDFASSGTLNRARGVRLGFLPQRPTFDSQETLWDEMLDAFHDVRRMEAEIRDLEALMSSSQCSVPGAMQRYGELQEQFERAGGYVYESRIRMVLQGMGFTHADYPRPLPQFSGGQQTRALLAKLLLQAPDLLVLDEPTNHLDIEAVEWLEGYLKDFPGALLVVSHDRYFMDAVVSVVWELDFGELAVFRGSYSAYTRQRGERYERLQKEYESQREFVEKEEEYIRRNIAGQNTRQAQGRRRRLERLMKEPERYGLVKRPPTRQQMKLRLAAGERSGDRVLSTKALRVGYHPEKPLFAVPDLTLWRGETAALIGPNGAGKSTLLKTILGQLPPLAGTAALGASVSVGYFAQAHEALDGGRTLLDEVLAVKAMTVSEARDYLALFLFHGDDAFRQVSTLSGGERGRLALAKLSLAGANVLLLDEPTNHLDIASQEILQDVLNQFDGTIILVTHDRYLVDALATQLWHVKDGVMSVFSGTYADYLAQRDAAPIASSTPAEKPKAAASNGEAAKKHGLNPYQLKKRVAEVEDQIQALEARVGALHDAIADASARGDSATIAALGAQYTQAEAELHAAMLEWERLVE